MLQSKVRPPAAGPAVVTASIWTMAPVPVVRPPLRAQDRTASREARHPWVAARPSPPVDTTPQAIVVAPAPPASAASEPWQPLRLTLSREQLRALEAATGAGLGGRGTPKVSELARLGADVEVLTAKALPHGETEVHVHGSCYRLMPSMPSQFDPFNHANQTLVAPC